MKEDNFEVQGVVIQHINGTNFRVQISDTDHIIEAYISGKMYKHNISVLAGDKVVIIMNKYDLSKGRIKFRARDEHRTPRKV
jgi:translation initiation factor IF-1